jgi:N6-L-threonylcarbamoyladenine synthase
MRVLGIETSCDETAVAVVEARRDDRPVGRILANVVYSQLAEHRRFGGVVPEIAARAHLERIDGLVAEALADAEARHGRARRHRRDRRPGLIGGVMVGVMTAKAIAFAHDKPFLAINHLEGHALSVRLTEPVDFPYLLLLVSGGHCQLPDGARAGRLHAARHDDRRCGRRMLRQDRPSCWARLPRRPAVEKAAQAATAALRPAAADVAQAGLRLLLLRPEDGGAPARRDAAQGRPQAVADLCASFQRTVGDVLADRCANALSWRRATRWSWRAASPPTSICAAGSRRWARAGRAADQALHRQRRDDRLGGHRAAAPRHDRCARLRAAAALAARCAGAGRRDERRHPVRHADRDRRAADAATLNPD